MNKMAVRTYASIITLTAIDCMFQSKDTEGLNGYKTKPLFMLPTRDSLQISLQTHKDWNWGDRKGIPCKQKSKQSRSSNTYMGQNKFPQNRDCYKDKEGYFITIKESIQEQNSGSAGKESACNAGDLALILGLGRSPGEGKGYPLQYSGLENSMDSIVHGVTKSPTRLRNFYIKLHKYICSQHRSTFIHKENISRHKKKKSTVT